MSIGNSILRGTRYLYNENWIVDFQGMSGKYRESAKTVLDSESYPDWIDTLTVREQDITARLMNLEPNDLLNIASGRLSEFLLDKHITGAKNHHHQVELENLLRNIEQKADQIISKHLETKVPQDLLDTKKDPYSERFRSSRKSIDNTLKKEESVLSMKTYTKDGTEVGADQDIPEEIILGASFSESIYQDEWKRPQLVRDVIKNLDQVISEKYFSYLTQTQAVHRYEK
jgi:hypothetical protein